MNYSIEYARADTTFFIMAMVMMVLYLLMFVYAIVAYILESLGVYTIAKRRGIKHPWLAWIPVGNMWLWGCISDQYQYVVKGKVKNRRKVILALSLVALILAAVLVGLYVNLIMRIVMQGERLNYMTDAQIMQYLIGPMLSLFAVVAVTSIVSIILMVFQYMALYDLFTSCNPKNSVVFLVLSILFSVVSPFFIFACRGKDLGMPPRKPVTPEPVYIPAEPTWHPVTGEPQQPPVQPAEPPQEPWDAPTEE